MSGEGRRGGLPGIRETASHTQHHMQHHSHEHHDHEVHEGKAAAEFDLERIVKEIEKVAGFDAQSGRSVLGFNAKKAARDLDTYGEFYALPQSFMSKAPGLKNWGKPSKKILSNSDAFLKEYARRLQALLNEGVSKVIAKEDTASIWFTVQGKSDHGTGSVRILWGPKKQYDSH